MSELEERWQDVAEILERRAGSESNNERLAPAPMRTSMSKARPEPRTEAPSTPASRASTIASCITRMATGYSERI